MHHSYELKLKHPPDFRVSYRFYTPEEGGRRTTASQGYRSDFWYYQPDLPPNNIFMIWPEFEDEHRQLILDTEIKVPLAGTARMWIIAKERRPFHRERLKLGMTGYFMEGPRRVAICEVIEICGLFTNPI